MLFIVIYTIGPDFVASDLLGSDVRVNISRSEISRLADRIIAKLKEVHDAVASVPLDKVLYPPYLSYKFSVTYLTRIITSRSTLDY